MSQDAVKRSEHEALADAERPKEEDAVELTSEQADAWNAYRTQLASADFGEWYSGQQTQTE